MTMDAAAAGRLERARHADEEVRYRATLELDGGAPAELAELLARLAEIGRAHV